MTEYMFRHNMKRLAEVFGEKAYPRDRTEILWTYVKDCSDEAFGNWISRVIADSKFAPLGEQFREFARGNQERQEIPKSATFCTLCGNGGRIIATRISDKYKFAFSCTCAVGDYWNKEYFPRWNGSEKYQIELVPLPYAGGD